MFDGGWLLHDREIDGMLSGTVEAVLHALIRLRLKRVVTQVAVTETLQQATGQIGEAAEQLPRRAAAFRRQAPQQAAGFEDLQDHMSDLHQIVVRFEQFRTRAVRVFEIQAAVLLTIETLVLHMPAMSASFRGEFDHRVFTYVQIGDPSKGGGLFVEQPRKAAEVVGNVRMVQPVALLVDVERAPQQQLRLRQPIRRL